MRRTRSSQAPAARGLAVLTLLALAAMPGCYRRVVDARGIGGDSEKLRERQEREPALRDVLTTTNEREKRSTSGVR